MTITTELAAMVDNENWVQAHVYKEKFFPTTRQWMCDIVNEDGTIIRGYFEQRHTKKDILTELEAIPMNFVVKNNRPNYN